MNQFVRSPKPIKWERQQNLPLKYSYKLKTCKLKTNPIPSHCNQGAERTIILIHQPRHQAKIPPKPTIIEIKIPIT